MHLLASFWYFLHIEQIRSIYTYQASCSENLYSILTIKTRIPQCFPFVLAIVRGLFMSVSYKHTLINEAKSRLHNYKVNKS